MACIDLWEYQTASGKTVVPHKPWLRKCSRFLFNSLTCSASSSSPISCDILQSQMRTYSQATVLCTAASGAAKLRRYNARCGCSFLFENAAIASGHTTTAFMWIGTAQASPSGGQRKYQLTTTPLCSLRSSLPLSLSVQSLSVSFLSCLCQSFFHSRSVSVCLCLSISRSSSCAARRLCCLMDWREATGATPAVEPLQRGSAAAGQQRSVRRPWTVRRGRGVYSSGAFPRPHNTCSL